MNGLAPRSARGSCRKAWPTLVLAALALRAIVPAGYMPGSIPDGELMVLCPEASAAAFTLVAGLTRTESGHAHHHHHGHSGTDSGGTSVDSRCPIGTALKLDAIAPSYPAITAADTAADYALPALPARKTRRAARHFDTRAPPPA